MFFSARYGIYAVDFESINKTRTIKQSGEFFKKVIATRCVSDEECSADLASLNTM